MAAQHLCRFDKWRLRQTQSRPTRQLSVCQVRGITSSWFVLQEQREQTRFLRKCALPGRDEIVTLYFTSTYISTYAGRFWKALYEKGRFVGGGRKSMVEGFERCGRRLRAAQSAVSK